MFKSAYKKKNTYIMSHEFSPQSHANESEGPESLASLTSAQWNAMANMENPTKNEASEKGLPYDEGVQTYIINGEEIDINTNLNDYGTRVRPRPPVGIDLRKETEANHDLSTPERPVSTPGEAKDRIQAIIASGKGTNSLADILRYFGETPESILNGLHQANEQSRERVRGVLMLRLEQLINNSEAEVPDRIVANGEKAVTNPEYYEGREKMASRDYTVGIAMAYLDGSFNTEREVSEGGEIGQHRKAAQMIINSFVDKDAQKADRPELFSNDKLQRLQRELKETAAQATQELGRLEQALDKVQHYLAGSTLVNIDFVNEHAQQMYNVLGQNMSKLSATKKNLDSFMRDAATGSSNDNEEAEAKNNDKQKTEAIQKQLLVCHTTLEIAYNSRLAERLRSLQYNTDQTNIQELQAIARIDHDQGLVYYVGKAKGEMRKLADSL